MDREGAIPTVLAIFYGVRSSGQFPLKREAEYNAILSDSTILLQSISAVEDSLAHNQEVGRSTRSSAPI